LQANFKIEQPGLKNNLLLQDPVHIKHTCNEFLQEELRMIAGNLILMVSMRIKQIILRQKTC